VFIISTISSECSSVGICGPLWEAGSVRSTFFLGRVVLVVTARVASLADGATENCELRLNLGYKEFLYLPLSMRGMSIYTYMYIYRHACIYLYMYYI